MTDGCQMMRPRLALMLLVAFAIGGCLPGRVAPVVGQRCEGVPAAMCAQILEDARRDAPEGAGDVVGIAIRCTIPRCTEGSGEVAVTVTYADGRTISSSQGWAQAAPAAPDPPGEPGNSGPTALPVEPTCAGVAREPCLEMGGLWFDDAPPGAVPVSILVRCTSTCDELRGDGETVVRFADGTSQSVGWSYSNGQ